MRIGRALGTSVAVVSLLAACSSGSDGSSSGSSSPVGSVSVSGRGPSGNDSSPASGQPLARYASHDSTTYADPAHWICRPDKDDVCDSDLDATIVNPDGTFTPEPFVPAANPAFDCFYVYPTVSRDPGARSDLVPQPDQEIRVTAAQAARLGTQCRVFAPVYRQFTLTGLQAALAGTTTGTTTPTGPPAYDDVLDAFKQYMAKDNGGRGVVLIGHSQGSSHLTRLIREEIDPNPDVRAQLISAYLAGSAVTVPEGRDVGGDFQNVPACRSPEQTGCVLSWATFRAASPPPANSRFGKPRPGAAPGVALCTNPASLTGGRVPLEVYLGKTPRATTAMVAGGGGGGSWVTPPREIPTEFVSLPNLVEGECVSTDGFNYLAVTTTGDPADPRADDIGGDLTPDWGLHLVDVSVVMGDIVDLVGKQGEAFRPPAR